LDVIQCLLNFIFNNGNIEKLINNDVFKPIYVVNVLTSVKIGVVKLKFYKHENY